MVLVKPANPQKDMAHVYEIRKIVFVEEQGVPPEEEYDGLDEESHHFLAWDKASLSPCGTARWRYTQKGIKLERFAVLPAYRKQGIGSQLVSEVLRHIKENAPQTPKLYLHAQIQALSLYERFDFVKVGNEFVEAGIRHYVMELPQD